MVVAFYTRECFYSYYGYWIKYFFLYQHHFKAIIIFETTSSPIRVVNVLWFDEIYGYLIHDGQQFTEGQTESPEGITVFKLQGQAML